MELKTCKDCTYKLIYHEHYAYCLLHEKYVLEHSGCDNKKEGYGLNFYTYYTNIKSFIASYNLKILFQFKPHLYNIMYTLAKENKNET